MPSSSWCVYSSNPLDSMTDAPAPSDMSARTSASTPPVTDIQLDISDIQQVDGPYDLSSNSSIKSFDPSTCDKRFNNYALNQSKQVRSRTV